MVAIGRLSQPLDDGKWSMRRNWVLKSETLSQPLGAWLRPCLARCGDMEDSIIPKWQQTAVVRRYTVNGGFIRIASVRAVLYHV